MRKKILFMIINMNIGGTEKALLNMLSEIEDQDYDVTILMLEEYGEFLNLIPKNVKVEFLQEYTNYKWILNDPPHLTVLHFLRNGQLIKALNIFLCYLSSKVLKDRRIFFKYVLKDYHNIKTEYDIAVAYAGPMDFISYFVINKIKAKKKIQWIHFDITQIGFNQKFASTIYKKFDNIFVVSKEGKDKLISCLPGLRGITHSFHNIISTSSIIKMANAEVGFEDNFSGVRILTVGRMTKEKGQDLTIAVLAKLRNDGYNVRWYCVGDGGARKEYENIINAHGVKDDFILLGSTPNPYPYMKECDLYVQPSRHEGYCITLAEAKCFNKPIISTNFTGASEQIINNQTGLIVNFDEQEMYTAIKLLLDDEALRKKFGENSQTKKKNPSNEIHKLFNIISN